MDAHQLYQALDTFNRSLLNDIKRHYANPEKYSYPAKENPLIFETAACLESVGLDDPMHKIYVTTEPLEGLPVLLFLFLLTYLPKVCIMKCADTYFMCTIFLLIVITEYYCVAP